MALLEEKLVVIDMKPSTIVDSTRDVRVKNVRRGELLDNGDRSCGHLLHRLMRRSELRTQLKTSCLYVFLSLLLIYVGADFYVGLL